MTERKDAKFQGAPLSEKKDAIFHGVPSSAKPTSQKPDETKPRKP